jgi:hypothetical protein
MPSSSVGFGTCVRTITPMTVAVAGSRDTMRAYVARGRRWSASWSAT